MSWELGNYGFLNIDSIAEQSLCIRDLGIEIRSHENYRFDNGTRDYHGYLFQYTLDGYGVYESQGIQHKLTTGKAFFMSFPEDSTYYLPQPEEYSEHHWTFFYLHFSGPAVEPFFNRIREIAGPVLDLGLDSIPVSLFSDLYDMLQSKKQLTRYTGSEWLYRFLISLLRNTEFPPYGKISPHVTAAIEWMKQNYTKQINLEDMCPEIGVSYSHLTRQFYKEQGITPVQFNTQLRLEHGMQLLLNTDKSIEKIAEECGFSSANYFTKVYKRALHITPSEYRRQHRVS